MTDASDWVRESTYVAKIGGLLYRNVTIPIWVNGSALVEVFRHRSTRELSLCLDVTGPNGDRVCTLGFNRFHRIAPGYTPRDIPGGQSLTEDATGRIVAEFHVNTPGSEVESEVSAITHLPDSTPLYLNPARTIVGHAPPDVRPNVTGLGLNGSSSPHVLGIAIADAPPGVAMMHFGFLPVCLVDCAFVQCYVGIAISVPLNRI